MGLCVCARGACVLVVRVCSWYVCARGACVLVVRVCSWCVCARGACATYVFVGGTKGKREPGTEKAKLFCFCF